LCTLLNQTEIRAHIRILLFAFLCNFLVGPASPLLGQKKNILFIATSMVSYFHPKPRTTVIVLGSQEWQPGPAAGAAAPTQMHVKVAGCGCIAVAVATTVAFSTDHCTTRNHIAPH